MSGGGDGSGHIFHFGDPWLQICNVNILIYLCIRTNDTGCSFELIFMKFTLLVRDPSWVNRIVLRNDRLNRTADMAGGNVSPKPVVQVWVGRYVVFWGNNLKTVIGIPFLNIFMYKNKRYRSQFWTDFHETHIVGAGPLMGEPNYFRKQSTQ